MSLAPPEATTDKYGRVSPASKQTMDALQRSQNILAKPQLPYEKLANPQFAAPGTIAPTKTVGYVDPYGREGKGLADDTNKVLRGPRVTHEPAKPPPPPPSLTDVATPPVSPVPPGAADIVPDTSDPRPLTPGIDSIPGALSLASVGFSLYDIYNAGQSTLINTGWGAGALNAIDAFGTSTGYFTEFGHVPGWEWGDDGFMHMTGADTTVGWGQTSLTNSIGYGMAGGAVVQLLGGGHTSQLVNMGASALGGIGGAALAGTAAVSGTSIGTALGASLGPVGAFLGGAAATVLAGMFGPRPSDNLAGGMYDLSTGQVVRNWTFQGKKYSAANNQARDTFFQYSGQMAQGMQEAFGGTVGVNNLRIDLGRHTGVKVAVGSNLGYGDNQMGQEFTNGQEAMGYVGKEMLRTMVGVPEEIAIVQQGIDWSKATFESAYADMNFAKEFNATTTAFYNGTFTVDQDRDTALQTIDRWEENAKRLYSTDESKLSYITGAAVKARTKIQGTQ